MWLNSSERKREDTGSGRGRSHTARQEHRASTKGEQLWVSPVLARALGVAARERHEPRGGCLDIRSRC